MKNSPISRIMSHQPATVAPMSTVAAAERVMRERRCHHVPVVDDGRLVGMISARDLLKALVESSDEDTKMLKQAGLAARRVADVMQRKVVALVQSATLLDAAQALIDGGVHALPVVGPNHALVGIVTSTDVMEAVVAAIEESASASAAAAAMATEQRTEPATTSAQARLLR
jgi:CBS domain-containing protein